MSTYPRLDATGLATLVSQIVTDGDGRWVKKVDLVKASASADGLMSKEDFTKLDGIDTGAQTNVIETVKVNGTALTPDSDKAVDVTVPVLGVSVNGNAVTPDATSKVADITVPTKVSDLNNDSKYQTEDEVAQSISDAIADVTQFDYEVVASLPTAGVKGKIYLVANSGTDPNIYDEYIWIGDNATGKFELLGTTQLSLDGYVKAEELTTISNDDIVAAVNSAFGVTGS